MVTVIKPELGKKYSFETLAPSVLGAIYQGWEFTGEVPSNIALLVDPNLRVNYASINPSLTPSVNMTEMVFWLFKNPNSTQQVAFGVNWINRGTFEKTDGRRDIITIDNPPSGYREVLLELMAGIGIDTSSISIKTV